MMNSSLIKVIIKELRMRNFSFDKKEKIVLVGEWDTIYARGLKKSFKDELIIEFEEWNIELKKSLKYKLINIFKKLINKQVEYIDETSEKFLYDVTYLRGLDGLKANNKKSREENKKQQTEINNGSKQKQDKKNVAIERPIGESQYDYLRRLSTKLKKISEKGEKISAIGIMGSDVYDKLLILQALRPEFKDVLFFTTDLDARLFHTEYMPYTRNLIVASAFGLELNDDLQAGIPPFRDSYQTSLYFSTLLALNKCETDCDVPDIESISSPRLYEIGHHGPVDLSKNLPSQQGDNAFIIDLHDEPIKIKKEETIHPKNTHFFSSNNKGMLLTKSFFISLLLIVFGISIGYILDKNTIDFKNKSITLDDYTRYFAFLGLTVFIAACVAIHPLFTNRIGSYIFTCVVLLWYLLYSYYIFIRGKYEKTNNIIHRVLIVCFILLGLALINLIVLHSEFGEPFSLRQGVSIWPGVILRLLAAWLAVHLLIYGWNQVSEKAKYMAKQLNSMKAVSVQWNTFSKSISDRKTIFIVILLIIIYSAACSMLILSIGDLPNFPGRQLNPDDWTYIFLKFSWVLPVFVLNLLIVFSILTTYRFIILSKSIIVGRTVSTNYNRRIFQVIADQSKEISELIYYPIYVNVLLAVSRLTYFDAWNLPNGLILIMGLNFLLPLVAAFSLRRMAVEIKRNMKGDLQKKLIDNVEDNDQQRQIQIALDWVETFNEGAFASFTEQPLFKALVLILGGGGSILLLEYLVLL